MNRHKVEVLHLVGQFLSKASCTVFEQQKAHLDGQHVNIRF